MRKEPRPNTLCSIIEPTERTRDPLAGTVAAVADATGDADCGSPRAKVPKKVKGKIALVAGATRGAGRGIAIAWGEAGATVYCTGRSSRGRPATPDRPETIAELVTAAGGRGIAVKVDHTKPIDEKKLVAGIKRRHTGLDILVNDVCGDALTEFGKTFWRVHLNNGLRLLKQAIHSHIITAYYAVPLMLSRDRGTIFEITDGDGFYYRGNLFYDLVKISVIRLAFAMGRELRKREIVSVALTPGFLRPKRYWNILESAKPIGRKAGRRTHRGEPEGSCTIAQIS